MKYLIVIVLFTFSFIACKKETENIGLTDVTAYYPMSVGKVFIYRMDSTRLINFTDFVTAYYLVKDSVAGKYVDNLGDTSYTVFRYITDTLAKQPFQYSETHSIVYAKNKIEYVDGNNARFIPLANPVSFNTSWSGNAYLDIDKQRITDNTTYHGWTYQYTSINEPYTVFDSTFQNTVKVQQAADSSGVFDPNILNSKTYSVEVYAKGVGLVYKEIMNYFFQPPVQEPYKAGYYEDGCFGIKLRLVSHK